MFHIFITLQLIVVPSIVCMKVFETVNAYHKHEKHKIIPAIANSETQTHPTKDSIKTDGK